MWFVWVKEKNKVNVDTCEGSRVENLVRDDVIHPLPLMVDCKRGKRTAGISTLHKSVPGRQHTTLNLHLYLSETRTESSGKVVSHIKLNKF